MLGFDIRWSEVPIIIKVGLFIWLVAILCFAFMVASAIFPSLGFSSDQLLKVAYFGGTLFIVGVLMVVIGLPKVQNHHPATKPKGKKKSG